MGYTAMRGGLEAIQNAEALVTMLRPNAAPDLAAAQVRDHLRAAVDRAMGEGGLYDHDLAALAVRQSEGDPAEAALLLRAYRSTLPRLAYSEPCESEEMDIVRRITPAFKAAPGGQILGRTRDYTQRLLDFTLVEPRIPESEGRHNGHGAPQPPPRFPKLTAFLREEGLLAVVESAADEPPDDITRDPLRFPASRSARLQALARGDTDAMTALAYSTMRGYGVAHSTLAELRVGYLPVRVRHPYTGAPVCIGEIEVTEVEDLNISKHTGAAGTEVTRFMPGYGIAFGQNERKAIAMALLDRAILGGRAGVSQAPAADEEFVLTHIDSIEAAGFLEHLKLPHYVEAQAIMQRMHALVNAELPSAAEAALQPSTAAHGPVGVEEPTVDEHAMLHRLGIPHSH